MPDTQEPAQPQIIEVGECCANCQFFLPYNADQGACRRYPAVPIMTVQGIMSAFPTMMNLGWCGEGRVKS